MQQLNELKDKGQHGLEQVVDAGKKQSGNAKTFAVTAGAAVVGGIALAAAAKPVIALTSMLATPPVALAVGSVAGGVWGWRFVRRKPNMEPAASADAAPAPAPDSSPDQAAV